MTEVDDLWSEQDDLADERAISSVDADDSSDQADEIDRPDAARSDTEEATAERTSGRRRRRRLSKWDRPPPPRDWRWAVGLAGRTLITVGILMFGFVAYQLWGTGIENAAAQRALEDDFEELLAEFDPPDPPEAADADTTSDANGVEPSAVEPGGDVDTDTTPDQDQPAPVDPPDTAAADTGTDTAPEPDAPIDTVAEPPVVVPASEQNLPFVENGDAVARLEIPTIGVNEIVVAGVGIGDLKRGPGHFPDTPLPGQLGNSALAGHRTGHGAPFFKVNELASGDEIRVTTLNGVFVYRVTDQRIVSPSQYGVVATTDWSTASLTLVSCHPRYTARERIIVSAILDPVASAAVGEPVLDYGRPPAVEPATPETLPGETATPAPTTEPAFTPADPTDEGPATTVATDAAPAPATPTTVATAGAPAATAAPPAGAVEEQIADVFSRGWFSDPAANPHVGFWGLVLTAIALLSYALSRRVRHDSVGLLVGIVPFVVALYFFFQNVNRLLPPNL